MDLSNKIALVTGGSKGIGAATAIALAQKGADVAIVARHHDEPAKQTLTEIEKAGRRGVFIQADMAVPEEAKR